MDERKAVINVLTSCKGDEKKMMNRVGKYSFSYSTLESIQAAHSVGSCMDGMVTDCLLSVNTAAAADRIFERKCHNLNSFRPQNLRGKLLLTHPFCMQSGDSEMLLNSRVYTTTCTDQTWTAERLWITGCSESKHSSANQGRAVEIRVLHNNRHSTNVSEGCMRCDVSM